MVEKIKERRPKTAKECAEYFGVTERAIRYRYAEPREEYLARAKIKADRVLQLRVQGLKLREIAAEMGISYGTVGGIVAQAKRDGLLEEKVTRTLKQFKESNPPD